MTTNTCKLAVIAAFLLHATFCAQAREWSDASGNFRIEAELVRQTKTSVVLRKADGKEVEVPIAKLSDGDQAFLKQNRQTAPAQSSLMPDGSSISVIEKRANSQRTAAAAVRVYENAIAQGLPPAARDAAAQRLEAWKKLAAKDSIRFSGKWLPASEARKIEDEEKQLMLVVQQSLDGGKLDVVARKLRDAAKLDSPSIRGDFTLGMLQALVGRDFKEAEECFQRCVQRRGLDPSLLNNAERANLAAALNNLALTKIRVGEFRSALNFWNKSLEVCPATPEILQNLEKMSQLPQTHPYLKMEKALAASVAAVRARVASPSDSAQDPKAVGWLYMRHVTEPAISDWLDNSKAAKAPTPANAPATPATPTVSTAANAGNLICIGGGSGFAVQDGLFLTNKHVIEDAGAVAIAKPGAPNVHLPATVKVISDEYDLALLECPSLHVAPVVLSPTLPKLAESIVVLGYPKFDVLGQDLKVTQGIISGLPNASFDNMLLYDATANPGNSGGPICNLRAQVVAVCTAGLEEQKLGLGIPSVAALQFLKGHVNLPPAPSTTTDLTQANVVEQVGGATVNVLVFQRAETPGFGKQSKGRQAGDSSKSFANGIEDIWCMGCNGTQKVECPVKGCSGGKIRIVVQEAIGRNSQNGMVLGKTKSVVDICDTCHGHGKVECPVCSDGTDRLVRK